MTELPNTDSVCSPEPFSFVSQKFQKTIIAYIKIKVSNGYSQNQLCPEHIAINVNTS